MADYVVSGTSLTSVADAIRAKTGGNSSLQFPTGFVNEMDKVPSLMWQRPAEFPDYSKIDISQEECIFFTYDTTARDSMDWMSIYVECSGGYIVERGYLVDGVWTVEETHSVSSSTVFNEYLPTDRDYTVYKVKPSDGNHITLISMNTPNEYNGFTGVNNETYYFQKCVERYGNLPYVTQFGKGYAYRSWSSRYVVAETQLSCRSVTTFVGKFQNFYRLKYIKLADFGNKTVTNMSSMFADCWSLEYIDVTGWNTGGVTTMKSMFQNCFQLRQIKGINLLDTSSVESMEAMFQSCYGLKELNIGNWDTSSVTTMKNMFYNCSGLNYLNLNSWDVSSVTTVENMFRFCRALRRIDFDKWDTSAITNAAYTFCGCLCLIYIDVSDWDTSSFSNINHMFDSCASLKEIDVGSWDLSSTTNMQNLVSYCYSLLGIKFTKIPKVYSYMFNGCTGVSEYIFDVESVPVLDNTSNVFSGNKFSQGARIKFPASLVDEAKATTNWSTYANYIEAIT